MSLANERDGDRRRKSHNAPEGDTSSKGSAKKKKGDAPEIGHALRSVYDRALQEDIPPDLLDLLGKLG